jgi:hypothetical protein
VQRAVLAQRGVAGAPVVKMRVTSKLFQSLYLAPRQLLLSARSVKVIYELFTMLDVVGEVRERTPLN